MLRNHIIILITLFLTSSCSHRLQEDAVRPDWLDGQSASHPRTSYLLGTGIASSLDEAKDRARSDIAKQFQVVIRDSSFQEQSYSLQEKPDGAVESNLQNFRRSLHTSTSQILTNLEIVAVWYDQNQQQHHALAVLPRGKASRDYKQKIRRMDATAKAKILLAQTQSAPLHRVARIVQAITLIQERRKLNSALQVVDLSGRGLAETIDFAALERSRDALLAEIRVAARSNGYLKAQLSTLLQSKLAQAGFKSSLDDGYDYLLTGTIHKDQMTQHEGWNWLRATLELTLKDSADRLVANRRWQIKTAAQTSARNQQRMLATIDQIMRSDLQDFLIESATSTDSSAP